MTAPRPLDVRLLIVAVNDATPPSSPTVCRALLSFDRGTFDHRVLARTGTVDHYISATLAALGALELARPGWREIGGYPPRITYVLAVDMGSSLHGSPRLVWQSGSRRMDRPAHEKGGFDNGELRGRAHIHRWIRTPVTEEGAAACPDMVDRNGNPGVTWNHSSLSEDKRTSYCIYDPLHPEAIRRAAECVRLPVDRITKVTVLDPYFYQ